LADLAAAVPSMHTHVILVPSASGKISLSQVSWGDSEDTMHGHIVSGMYEEIAKKSVQAKTHLQPFVNQEPNYPPIPGKGKLLE
jgi:hypothetical protein